jgi:hypothetical protein
MLSYPPLPNEAAEVAFRDWLDEILADDVPFNSMASPLLWQQDWSVSKTVEVPGDKTKSGKPHYFAFSDRDLIPDGDPALRQYGAAA